MAPRYKVGQLVTFINDYGVAFPHRLITGVVFDHMPHVPIAYHVVPSDTPWYPYAENKLFVEYDQEQAGVVKRRDHGWVIETQAAVYLMDDECFDMLDGVRVMFTPDASGWVRQSSWRPLTKRPEGG